MDTPIKRFDVIGRGHNPNPGWRARRYAASWRTVDDARIWLRRWSQDLIGRPARGYCRAAPFLPTDRAGPVGVLRHQPGAPASIPPKAATDALADGGCRHRAQLRKTAI
jgi:hypothetical protein